MKRKTSKLLAIVISLIMTFSLVPSIFNGTALASEGKGFSSTQVYQLSKSLSATPLTFEAWIKLSPTQTGRAGIIFGNYKDNSSNALSFEIKENGNPRVYYGKTTASTVKEYVFTTVDVRSTDWVHLAFAWEGNNLHCYLNGELKASTVIAPPALTLSNNLCIGGDLRPGNVQYFKGLIKQVAVFKDMRTQAEIQADMNELAVNDPDVLVAYNINSSDERFTDLTGGGNTAISKWYTRDEINIPDDYEFSFMAIGDTQIVTYNFTSQLHNIYDYVVDNAQTKKVKHVFGLGDITDRDTDAEWNEAKKQIARMDGVVNYSIIRGNHDIYSTNKNMKLSSKYDQIYGPTTSPYAEQYTYCFEGEGADFRARNTIHFFSSSSRDYMVVALDYGASDNVLAWANEMVEAHPYHNVIVTTHAYLATDGTTLDAGDNCPPTRDYNSSNSYGVNNGDHMWDEFIKKHENIVLVMSGHDPMDDLLMVQTEGEKGNIVTQILIDPQAMDIGDPTGMVATFYVAENGEDVTVEWYSTIKNLYYKQTNNYSFKLNVIEREVKTAVTYNANGGSGEMQPSYLSIGETLTLPSCAFTAPKNHVFKGWSFTQNGEIITTETLELSSDVTLYAIWERVPYKVTFNANGGTGEMATVDCYTDSYTLPSCDFTPPSSNYRFKGWAKVSVGNPIKTSAILLSSDVTLYAIWERIPCTVTFNANGGSGSMESATVSSSFYTLPSCEFTPPANNYEFKGWALTENGTVITDEKLSMQQDVTLYAIWGEKATYVISASANNGGTISVQNQTTVYSGDSLTVTITANEGYAISSVVVNGVSVGAVSSYTFENVNQDCTITVTFVSTQTPPVVGPETPTTPGGDGSSAGSAGCSKSDNGDLSSIAFMCLLSVLVVSLTKKKRYA